jgi:hypothetical protein
VTGNVLVDRQHHQTYQGLCKSNNHTDDNDAMQHRVEIQAVTSTLWLNSRWNIAGTSNRRIMKRLPWQFPPTLTVTDI